MTTVHQARDDANRHARLIANYVASSLPVPAELVDEYKRSRGAVDRLVDEAEADHACPGETRCLHRSHRRAQA